MTDSVRRQLAAALLALFAHGPPARAQPCDATPLVIRNVRVWTPEGVLSARDVVVETGRVKAVEPTGANRSAMRVLDGTGHTLLPGLVDAHLHFSVPGGLPGAGRNDTSTITARQLLTSGVTSGRLHLTSIDEATALKARSQDPCAAIPLLQVGGPGLSGAAERDFPAFQSARTADDAVAKVRRFGAAGIDWVACTTSIDSRPASCRRWPPRRVRPDFG